MKHYKNEISDNWPKAVSIKPVMGERGRKDLPPGTKGGENMTPDRHKEHKQHTFDSFCKRAIKYEALNAYRQIRYRRNCEISLSELPEEIMEQLAVYDRYPWEYHSFTAHGTVILIENDLLADALNQLSSLQSSFRLSRRSSVSLALSSACFADKAALSRRPAVCSFVR